MPTAPGLLGHLAEILQQIWPPQYRAFSRALEIKKLKAPLFPGHKGTGDTNDWYISHGSYCMAGMQTQIRLLREEHAARGMRCLSLSNCHTLPDSTNGRVTDSKILCPFVSVHMRFLSVPRACKVISVLSGLIRWQVFNMFKTSNGYHRMKMFGGCTFLVR